MSAKGRKSEDYKMRGSIESEESSDVTTIALDKASTTSDESTKTAPTSLKKKLRGKFE